MKTYSFHHPLRVRWAEVDRQGIVFNGHYLTYFDVGITEYWRAIGLPYPDGVADAGSDLYVVKTLINYHGSAEYDDVLDIGVRVARIGTSSMTFEVGISLDNELLIEGEVVYVNADPETRLSKPVPDKLRHAIEHFESKAAAHA
ncbi:MAG: MFS transporter [Rhodocyclaceae bacterium]|jgi:acyl-CoA thioester hydrolase|nr:MFS transporter [Rhodocyclaceae bacterium]